ncbi:MAG: hypothetical protein LBE57_04730 [Methanosarcinales archaeon]|jgi:hypothetical protein|nr:hypothetical protein [Methanosarcinales archaeon]
MDAVYLVFDPVLFNVEDGVDPHVRLSLSIKFTFMRHLQACNEAVKLTKEHGRPFHVMELRITNPDAAICKSGLLSEK